MLHPIHRIAGAAALAIIAAFWTATATSEAFLTQDAVVVVKTAIPWGFLVLIPALAATGASGWRLSGGQPKGLAARKRARMRIVAANGALVLVPAGLFLAAQARAGDLGTVFALVQAAELIAGAVNIALLSMNMRDGLRMTRARRAAA